MIYRPLDFKGSDVFRESGLKIKENGAKSLRNSGINLNNFGKEIVEKSLRSSGINLNIFGKENGATNLKESKDIPISIGTRYSFNLFKKSETISDGAKFKLERSKDATLLSIQNKICFLSNQIKTQIGTKIIGNK
jgi:hypothetical protein